MANAAMFQGGVICILLYLCMFHPERSQYKLLTWTSTNGTGLCQEAGLDPYTSMPG